ncbi:MULTISPECIES: tyrosine-type recombinase/integrase [unclassified Thiocapsa]|uniref:tyrosine-type recombinase/integrase n=1 Tax=unclassified Thiocapsa TaxID=2641286 RepID=UPI0035B190F1
MITVKHLQGAKPGEWLSDGGAHGAGVLLFRKAASGATFAYFRYTLSGGKRDTLPIGVYDETGRDGLTLAKARQKAGDLSRLYQDGVKNIRAHLEAEEAARKLALEAEQAEREAAVAVSLAAEARALAQAQYTLQALCDAYANVLEVRGKSKSAKDTRSAFKVHVLEMHPEIAALPAREVTSHHIAAMVRKVREAGKERTGGMLRSYLRAAFALAIRAPFDSAVPSELIAFEVTANPVDAIPTIPVKAGQRTLTRFELAAYHDALSDNLIDQALKLALLSGGQRMAQLLRIRVSDYDRDTQVLKLWDGKGKRQDPREHLLPLGPKGCALVAELVERAKERADPDDVNPSLFMSRDRDGASAIVNYTTCSGRVSQIAKTMKGEPFNLRDIRRTVETQLASLGVSRDVRAQLLSHGLSGVQNQHYDRHTYIEEKRAALLLWERHLETLRETSQPT